MILARQQGPGIRHAAIRLVAHCRRTAREAALFGAVFLLAVALIEYLLSRGVWHDAGAKQFPIASLERFPLAWVTIPVDLAFLAMGVYFSYTAWRGKVSSAECNVAPCLAEPQPDVAVLIPACNEPLWVVQRTLEGCLALRWPARVRALLLDDSIDEESRHQLRDLAQAMGAEYLCRGSRDGFKGGNLNHAIATAVWEPYFVIFDADQRPSPSFLLDAFSGFTGPDVAFVQAPQRSTNAQTLISRASSLANRLYYQSLCPGKARDGAVLLCGTNVIVRTEAFREVGGFLSYSSTEDVDLGIRLNLAGYRSAFAERAVADGLAPLDLAAYWIQQKRWATGNLRVLRKTFAALVFGGMPLRWGLHILASLGWWLVGCLFAAQTLVACLAVLGFANHQTWYSGVAILLGLLYPALLFAAIWWDCKSEERKQGSREVAALYLLIWNSMFVYCAAAWNGLVIGRRPTFWTTPRVPRAVARRLVLPHLVTGGGCLGLAAIGLVRAAGANSLQAVRAVLPASTWLLVTGSLFLCAWLLTLQQGASEDAGMRIGASVLE